MALELIKNSTLKYSCYLNSLHPRSEYNGTGIGLTLVKKLIEGHGGEIWLKSEAGKGTTFYFTLAKPKKTNQ